MKKVLRFTVALIILMMLMTIVCYANNTNVYEVKGCDVVVAFVEGHNGSLESFAYDYYDYGSFLPDGIMLMVDTREREYYILTSGSCIQTFTDEKIYQIEDEIIPYLRYSDWSGAEQKFVSLCKAQLYSGITGLLIKLAASLGVGTLIGGAPLLSQKKQMENVSSKTSADDYIRPGSVALLQQNDNFKRKAVTRVPIPKGGTTADHSGGFSGSTTHVGSSGTVHGGHGGKF